MPVLFNFAQEELRKGQVIIDFNSEGETEEVILNQELYRSNLTATVLESPCLLCLKSKELDECKAINLCLDVNLN